MTDQLFPYTPSIRDQLDEMKHEKRLREQVWPRQINLRRMTKGAADRRMACLDAVIAKLQAEYEASLAPVANATPAEP